MQQHTEVQSFQLILQLGGIQIRQQYASLSIRQRDHLELLGEERGRLLSQLCHQATMSDVVGESAAHSANGR